MYHSCFACYGVAAEAAASAGGVFIDGDDFGIGKGDCGDDSNIINLPAIISKYEDGLQ